MVFFEKLLQRGGPQGTLISPKRKVFHRNQRIGVSRYSQSVYFLKTVQQRESCGSSNAATFPKNHENPRFSSYKNVFLISPFVDIFELRLKNIFMRGWSTECLPCGKKSRNPFAMILVPLERGGLRRHFELLSTEIHRRSSEKSSLEVGQVVIFWTLGSLKNVHKRCT